MGPAQTEIEREKPRRLPLPLRATLVPTSNVHGTRGIIGGVVKIVIRDFKVDRILSKVILRVRAPRAKCSLRNIGGNFRDRATG